MHNAFIDIIKHDAKWFDEIRVAFDHYISKSLKSNTRAKQNQGT